jgi:hypothetical protein
MLTMRQLLLTLDNEKASLSTLGRLLLKQEQLLNLRIL